MVENPNGGGEGDCVGTIGGVEVEKGGWRTIREGEREMRWDNWRWRRGGGEGEVEEVEKGTIRQSGWKEENWRGGGQSGWEKGRWSTIENRRRDGGQVWKECSSKSC